MSRRHDLIRLAAWASLRSGQLARKVEKPCHCAIAEEARAVMPAVHPRAVVTPDQVAASMLRSIEALNWPRALPVCHGPGPLPPLGTWTLH